VHINNGSSREGLSVEWREGSAMKLPFADDAFDVVFCQQGRRPPTARGTWVWIRRYPSSSKLRFEAVPSASYLRALACLVLPRQNARAKGFLSLQPTAVLLFNANLS
jgi:hypothetical protein